MTVKTAWLVTWEGTKPPAERVVAVLNYRFSDTKIRQIVEVLYAALTYTESDKLLSAKPRQNPYPAKLTHFERIDCGHNPFLYARRVTQVRMEAGKLVWIEPPSATELTRRLKGLSHLR